MYTLKYPTLNRVSALMEKLRKACVIDQEVIFSQRFQPPPPKPKFNNNMKKLKLSQFLYYCTE